MRDKKNREIFLKPGFNADGSLDMRLKVNKEGFQKYLNLKSINQNVD